MARTACFTLAALTVAVLAALGQPLPAAQCGSALLAETEAPAVFDGLQLDADTVARFWEEGAASSAFGSAGCLVGCASATGAACAGSTECVAITGVNWLNSLGCASPGHAPARTVFLIEQPTAASGGRWAAFNLSRNPTNFNTDLDERAQTVCGGCSSVASPYLGGSGSATVDASSVTGGILSATLGWTAPPPAAQALSDGNDLVTSYALFYHPDVDGSPPPSTGEKAGWTLLQDLEPDGSGNGGYSTDTSAQVEVTLEGPVDAIYFAVGLNFDGSGDPSSDANTEESTFLSDLSVPVTVPTPCGQANELTLENQTVNTTQVFTACFSITAGNNFVVGPTGEVTFLAGESVALQDGFSVESGGVFQIQIDPTLTEY